MKVRLLSVLVAVLTAVVVAAGVYTGRTLMANRKAQAIERTPFSAAVMKAPTHDVGLVSHNLQAFVQACGCQPNVSVNYVTVGDTVSAAIPHTFLLYGATPLLEILPYNASLSGVISGKDDAWFRSYAQMIKSQQAQMLLSFAPEPNGDWYEWGWKQVPASQEIAAWRHVVTLFRAAGAKNATWVWIVNQLYPGSGALSQLWPGAAYVDEVGVDGYFRKPTDTFATVVVPTLKQIRQITSKPVFVSETGSNDVAGKVNALNSLVAGVAHYHLQGFVWFDINLSGLKLNEPQNFAITGNQSALVAFKNDVSPYERPVAPGAS